MRNVMFSFSFNFALLHLHNPPILNTFHFTSLHFTMYLYVLIMTNHIVTVVSVCIDNILMNMVDPTETHEG
jgi:hypothetical protein